MAKYIVQLRNSVTWEVEVEADSEYEAIELSEAWTIDDLKEEEIVNNCWDTEAWESDE